MNTQTTNAASAQASAFSFREVFEATPAYIFVSAVREALAQRESTGSRQPAFAGR